MVPGTTTQAGACSDGGKYRARLLLETRSSSSHVRSCAGGRRTTGFVACLQPLLRRSGAGLDPSGGERRALPRRGRPLEVSDRREVLCYGSAPDRLPTFVRPPEEPRRGGHPARLVPQHARRRNGALATADLIDPNPVGEMRASSTVLRRQAVCFDTRDPRTDRHGLRLPNRATRPEKPEPAMTPNGR